MARVSVAEGTRLSVFLARGLLGRVTSRVTTHPIVNWPFSFGKADRIAIEALAPSSRAFLVPQGGT